MAIPNHEQEPSDELGGQYQDTENRVNAYFVAKAKFEYRKLLFGGKITGPAFLAPLSLMLVAMFLGSVIWAMWSWQAGVAEMLGSLIVFLIFVSINRRSKRDDRP